jgi:hypothetical protein
MRSDFQFGYCLAFTGFQFVVCHLLFFFVFFINLIKLLQLFKLLHFVSSVQNIFSSMMKKENIT